MQKVVCTYRPGRRDESLGALAAHTPTYASRVRNSAKASRARIAETWTLKNISSAQIVLGVLGAVLM